MPTVKGAAPNPRSRKGTVNPAGIIRGSGGVRVASGSARPASPSASPRSRGFGTGNPGRGRVR